MEQYISKSALVAGIKKLYGNPFYRMAIKDVLSILDTLEVREVDLNEEFDKYFFNFVDPDTGEKLKRTECWLNIRQARKFAKHFFELGLLSTITEEDCKLIWNIGDNLPYMPEENFFGELLRRYKAQKGE